MIRRWTQVDKAVEAITLRPQPYRIRAAPSESLQAHAPSASPIHAQLCEKMAWSTNPDVHEVLHFVRGGPSHSHAVTHKKFGGEV